MKEFLFLASTVFLISNFGISEAFADDLVDSKKDTFVDGQWNWLSSEPFVEYDLKFQNPMKYLGEPSLGEVESFCKDRTSIQFPNSIDGGKIQQMCKDSDVPSIIVEFSTFADGKITLEIPRIILDHNNDDCSDRRLFTILNGEEVDYQEEKNERFRIITVPVTYKDHRLEVIASVVMVKASPGLDKCQKLIQDKFRPLEQVKYKITSSEIVCKDGLGLIFKHDASPSCVKQETIPKLIERGWANVSIEHDLKLEIQNNPKLSNGLKNSILSETAIGGFLSNPCDSSQKSCVVKIELVNGTDPKKLPFIIKELGFWKNMASGVFSFEEIQTISEFSEVKKISSGQGLR
ncbi:MAG TPA: hypothetical protein VMW74_07325 [Nitrosopumilaceae archaeon]|nr:hypothetical protein [Nitrosopumilaceae archaeon]